MDAKIERQPEGLLPKPPVEAAPPSCAARLPIPSREGWLRATSEAAPTRPPSQLKVGVFPTRRGHRPPLLRAFWRHQRVRAAAAAGWEVGLGRRQRPSGQARRGCGLRSGRGDGSKPEDAALFRQIEGVKNPLSDENHVVFRRSERRSCGYEKPQAKPHSKTHFENRIMGLMTLKRFALRASHY